jgi:hypothetical protein
MQIVCLDYGPLGALCPKTGHQKTLVKKMGLVRHGQPLSERYDGIFWTIIKKLGTGLFLDFRDWSSFGR